LSPTFFNLYIHYALRNTNVFKNSQLILYADDILLITNANTMIKDNEEIESALKHFALLINYTKSEIHMNAIHRS
jgi:hypothetical protein